MVFDGVILSLLVGFFRGGNLNGIASLYFKFGWIFPVLLIVQLLVFYGQNYFEIVSKMSTTIFILVYILGLVFLWINRNHKGIGLVFFGVLLNFVVMAFNGGRMPVSAEAATVLSPHYVDLLQSGAIYAKHKMMTESTILPFLGDIIALQPPYPRTQVISIGDVVMNVGIFIFIQNLMMSTSLKKAMN